jgi:aryl-alcohol dehydrogenase-like predicted oxidoreductase
MEYRQLGPTGTVVSRLALGTMYFGKETSQDEAFAIIDAFLDAGGNLIDTSNVYVGGVSQQIVGRWFASRPSHVTERVVMASKGRFATTSEPNGPGLSRRSLARSLDSSLRALGRDTIDLYQLHAWDPLTPVEETLAFLDDAVRAGKIHYTGLSNFTGWQTQLMVSTARQMGVEVPATLQVQYSLLSRDVELEVVPAALHNGLSVLPWSPLAGGLLSGKYLRGEPPAPGTRAGSDNPLYQWATNRYLETGRGWDTIDVLTQIAQETGATPAQVALSWTADQPGVVAPVVGARSAEQIIENLGAADLHLDQDARTALDEVSRPQPATYPYGAFGIGQRARELDGSDDLAALVAEGSDQPLGRP